MFSIGSQQDRLVKMETNYVTVNLSEIAKTPNLNMSAVYWTKRKRLETELDKLCIFSEDEKRIILNGLDKDGN